MEHEKMTAHDFKNYVTVNHIKKIHMQSVANEFYTSHMQIHLYLNISN